MTYTFVIPGPCVPKGRPRKGKYGNMYTPPETVAYETAVFEKAMYAKLPKLTGPLAVVITAYFNDKKATDPLPTTKHGDVDNLAKSVLDGLKPFFNDKIVYTLTVTKLLTPGDDFTEVVIQEWEG